MQGVEESGFEESPRTKIKSLTLPQADEHMGSGLAYVFINFPFSGSVADV